EDEKKDETKTEREGQRTRRKTSTKGKRRKRRTTHNKLIIMLIHRALQLPVRLGEASFVKRVGVGLEERGGDDWSSNMLHETSVCPRPGGTTLDVSPRHVERGTKVAPHIAAKLTVRGKRATLDLGQEGYTGRSFTLREAQQALALARAPRLASRAALRHERVRDGVAAARQGMSEAQE
ncbi:hypothetical protein C8J57DRAFT_1628736, partial [Mycena rebaudengoi]